MVGADVERSNSHGSGANKRVERRTTCNRDCADTCSIVATVDNERIVALRGDADHPVTRGALCYRTNQFLRRQYSPARLTSPLLRKRGELREVSWDEALDFIAHGLEAVRRDYGASAIVHYQSGGSLGLLKLLTGHFFSLFGPVTVVRGNICSAAGEAAQELDFGVCDSSDVFTLRSSKHIVIWGKNLVVTSPHVLRIVHEARKRGARTLLIDPIHQATVQHADVFIQPRPGGDFALAMAVAQLCFQHGIVAPEAAAYCDHFDAYRALVFQRSVQGWCAEADVRPEQALQIARALHEGPSAILVGWGMNRRSNGGAIVRALDALSALTGNLGVAGGGVAFYSARRSAFDLSFAQPSPAPRSVRDPLLAQDVLALRDPPARALWINCANPVAMLPDSEATARMLRELPLSVVADSFLTDTAQLATVVLPTRTLLEEDDLLGSYGHHYLSASQPVVAALSGVKSDLEIMQALAERVGLGDALSGSARAWKERMLKGKLSQHGIVATDLERAAQRSPLSAPVLFADRNFHTPSGKVNLITQAPPSAARPSAAYPLALLALATRDSQCSQWVDEPPELCQLTVHPSAAQGLADGALCEIESPLGRMPVRIKLDDKQRSDVALLPKGGVRSKNACANKLIRAQLTDLGEGGALYEEHIRIIGHYHSATSS